MMWPFKIAILGVVVNFVLMILMCGGPGEFYEVLQPLWLPTLDDGFKQFSKIQSASSGSTMFEGRTVLITGANRGYGKGAAENFLAAGATVIMACRSGIPSVGEQLVQKMKVDSGKVRMFKVDMGDVESVRNLVDALTAEKISLDIVVLNAALVDTASHKEKTNKGVGKIARMFQVNYLSNVVLLEELVDKNILDPKLLREKKPKVLFIGSGAYKHGTNTKFGVDEEWTAMGAMPMYGQTKFLNQIYMADFQQRHAGEILVATHSPGPVNTNMGSDEVPAALVPTYQMMKKMFFVHPREASRSLLVLASDDPSFVKNGAFMHIRVLDEVREDCSSDANIAWLRQQTAEALSRVNYTPPYLMGLA